MSIQYPDDSLALHTDLYQINMMYSYWKDGLENRRAVFEGYFRKLPFGSGYAINAGLERVIQYIEQLHFSATDIDYIQKTCDYDEAFIDYLRNFRFKGNLRAPAEGDIVFANEPVLQVEGTLCECQLVETALLNIVNFHILIATKASRVKTVAQEDSVMEFGTRRAQEFDAAIWGTRAAYIGGFDATSNVRAAKLFGIPAAGTHAHSLVQAYRNDYDAFVSYAKSHKNCCFLVDTYDTLKSGVPNAIRVAKEFGDRINFLGVRIDSGDMAYISKKVRSQLDEAGFPSAKIYASNDLDENTMLNLKMQGAKIDVWGIGTKLITAYDQPALGAVYKLVSVENDQGKMVDTVKISSNAEKITTPGKKQIWRITRNADGKSEGDYLAEWDEPVDQLDELFMFHPTYTYINKTVKDFSARPVLQDIFLEGKLVYQQPRLEEIKAFSKEQLDQLWDEYKRILNPEPYPVDLSQRLYDHKMGCIKDVRKRIDRSLK